ncbi:type IX secretion system periplasmic lipoprotein PorW/SprE [Sphingobacterium sp. UT-1RO-CII-1]|uniref:type IX secretion system periplasmic lipoprotein PorW/SprE n=1 Tax=Sphingobacterium sp. UT-1RO-CII-1 TaxID=2995225 RepID=UPI003FA363E3
MVINSDKRVWVRFLLFVQAVLLLFFTMSGCKSSKRKLASKQSSIDDSLKTDFFQNLTSKYNILYNANNMLEQERKSIYDGTGKNYQVRLSVFDEPTVNGDPHKAMDSLVQKAYKIVNTKQESKYVGEAYFIIGKAYYLKGSYYTAVEFFDKLIKDKEFAVKYRPLAYAWKSRALLQINKTEQAEKAVDSAFMFVDDNKKVRTFVNAAKANVLLRLGRPEEAVPFLEYALESNKDRYDKERWRFLLAQLYQEKEENEKARQMFEKMSRSNAPFDMSFEAALQAAFLEGKLSGDDLNSRVKPFLSMLRQGKHEGYKDQILYEVGKVYLVEGDEENAFKYFNLSLQNADASLYQTTETYLTLADYHFEKGRYHAAQLYYDSTASVLPNDYTDVNKVRRKLAYMGELTKLYEVNLWQDTLISLGKLDDEGRMEEVSKYAAKQLFVKQAETERQRLLTKNSEKRKNNVQERQQVFNNTFVATEPQSAASTFTDNRFYFNNTDALLLGASEFKRRWGTRQLKDDWRFSADNTASLSIDTAIRKESQVIASTDSLDTGEFLYLAKRRYLDSIPDSQSEYDRRLGIVHDNMIVIGNIYRDYTRDNRDAIIAYEAFLERFPNTTASAEVYYSLYRMYDEVDIAKSTVYKNKLIELFPNTLHAKVAKDPYYMDKVNRDKKVLDRAFERLFTLYAKGDYVEVIKQANEELQGGFEASTMLAQIEYLKALAIGRVGRVADFTSALETLVDNYPADSLVVPLALENLTFIESNPNLFVNRVNALQDIDKSRVAFVDEPDMTPWPALNIYGDYRTGVALVQPKKEEELKVEDPLQVEKESEKVELLLAGELDSKLQVKANLDLRSGQAELKRREGGNVIANLTIEEEEERKVATLDGMGIKVADSKKSGLGNTVVKLDTKAIGGADLSINYGPNEYRDKKLFPDTATYFFTINIKDPRVNLAPSRYGIGQFNRSRYQRANISHQLQLINAENQLLFVGPFETFEEVKTYESRILPLLPEIMKVPESDYNSFVITKELLGTLKDGIQISDYHQIYIEQ